jgi:hypothetical protein
VIERLRLHADVAVAADGATGRLFDAHTMQLKKV